MTRHKESVWLCDMRDNARTAIDFCRGRTRSDLDTDRMLALAIARLLEIIGEAARHVSVETRDKAPHIPWRQIIGTRDILTQRLPGYRSRYRVGHRGRKAAPFTGAIGGFGFAEAEVARNAPCFAMSAYHPNERP